MSAGKGPRPRPVRGEDYRKNHDRIFRNYHGPCLSNQDAMEGMRLGSIVDGKRNIGIGQWQSVDHREQGLTDED